MRLNELQSQFLDGIFSENPAVLGLLQNGGRIPATRQLQIYHNNTYLILTDVLRETFPAITALGSEKFFRYLANEYIKAHPPKAGDMNEYGATFPDFIATFPALQDHAYMADVARLEWARQASYLAADGKSITPVALQCLSEEQVESITLTLHPCLRLVQSKYPIARIWKAAVDGAKAPDITENEASVLVFRKGIGVEMWTIDPAMCTFIEACLSLKPLKAAITGALEIDKEFSADLHLTNLLQAGLIVGTTD